MKFRLINFLVNKLIALLNYKRKIDFDGLKSRPNVSIHDSVYLGEHSNIEVIGECGELTIAPEVVTRKCCNFLVYPKAKLIIGARVFFNNSCSVNCLGHVEIGENVMFGEGVKIYDHNHLFHYDDLKLIVHKNDFKIGKVVIGKNSWIASNVTILNNVEIGENVIIGANCLVYKSVPSNSVVKHVESLITTTN